MLAPLLAALLLSSTPDAAPQTRPPQAAPAIPSADAPTDLEDVVVEGRRLDEQVSTFVREVGQPARGRGLARWHDSVCVQAVNLRTETAQYLVDRVSTVAQDVGLRAGEPGCHPNIFVIATTDADAFTRRLVERRRILFTLGGAGTDLGRSALERFMNNDRPVRWWNVSMPIDEDTGQWATRLPGDASVNVSSEIYNPLLSAPSIMVNSSRLSTEIRDDSKRIFVIVDADKVSGVSVEQLGDYVAMVSLAQINPEADTSGYATVLNLFADPERTSGLTNWDKAYLQGLYTVQRTRRNPSSARTEVAASIIRAHHTLTAAQDQQGDPE